MIDELLLQQQQQEKGGTVTKSVVNTFPTEVEPDDDGDDDDSENEKRLTLSHDSLHGLWDLSKKSQNIVTEENVDNALLSFGTCQSCVCPNVIPMVYMPVYLECSVEEFY
ncbi:unnamed protein product [Trichobilharzia regenti]|nr:unnamed protein product [Trichobilharzia regenti]